MKAVLEIPTPAPVIPRRFGPLPGLSGRSVGRYAWGQPVRAVGRAGGFCCLCAERPDGTAWDEAAAPYILQEAEWRIWSRLAKPAARRRWMRGRVAAKDAVRLLLLTRRNIVAPLETIAVVPDELGAPRVRLLPSLVIQEQAPDILASISHCGLCSVAWASERGASGLGAGIDVASLADPHEGLAEGGFLSDETALLDRLPEAERAAWLLALWCAKEAVGKALGVGLQGNPHHYAVREIGLKGQKVTIEIRFPASPEKPGGFPRAVAVVGFGRGMAFAVAKEEG